MWIITECINQYRWKNFWMYKQVTENKMLKIIRLHDTEEWHEAK